jgi:hypothetical protein
VAASRPPAKTCNHALRGRSAAIPNQVTDHIRKAEARSTAIDACWATDVEDRALPGLDLEATSGDRVHDHATREVHEVTAVRDAGRALEHVLDARQSCR